MEGRWVMSKTDWGEKPMMKKKGPDVRDSILDFGPNPDDFQLDTASVKRMKQIVKEISEISRRIDRLASKI